MAIVSIPACPDANALEMVASVSSEEEDATAETNEVKETMPEENKVTNDIEQAEAVVQEEIVAETIPEKEEETAVAENAEAEVVHEDVMVRESVCKDEYDGKTYHTVTTEHTVVETVEEAPAAPAPVIAENEAAQAEDAKDVEIAELKRRIAELEVLAAELSEIKAAQAAAEHAAKVEKAKAFASKQGLDVEDEAVKEAVANLNYEAIAELAEAKEAENNKKPEVSMASYIDMGTPEKYGGMLDRS